jgi:DNA-binding NtrC family response regulator
MGMEAKILIADDERHVAEGLQMLLTEEGYAVDTATDGNAAWEMVQSGEYGLVLADLRMPEVDGLELFSRMRSEGIPSEIIIITGAASVDSAVTAVKQGAFYYLEKPLKIDSLKVLIQKALESYWVKQENRLLEERLASMTRFGDLIGQSEEMKQVYSIIEAAAPTSASILIVGESGFFGSKPPNCWRTAAEPANGSWPPETDLELPPAGSFINVARRIGRRL